MHPPELAAIGVCAALIKIVSVTATSTLHMRCVCIRCLAEAHIQICWTHDIAYTHFLLLRKSLSERAIVSSQLYPDWVFC